MGCVGKYEEYKIKGDDRNIEYIPLEFNVIYG